MGVEDVGYLLLIELGNLYLDIEAAGDLKD